jgi:hypothetical protein
VKLSTLKTMLNGPTNRTHFNTHFNEAAEEMDNNNWGPENWNPVEE